MFALSCSAGNGHVRNRYGYQGQERENTFALNLNEFEARHYDGQIGRWMVPDPAKQFPSPYVGMGNEWVSGVDPDGRIAVGVVLAIGAIDNIMSNKDQIKKATEGENGNAWRGIGMALGYGAVGAAGAYATSTLGPWAGFAIGGSLNVAFEGLTGQFKEKPGVEFNRFGRMAGSFLTGGLSAMAGKNLEGSLKSGGSLSDIQNRIFSANEVFTFNPLKGSSLAKFGLSGLQNLAGKLNYYNGKLDWDDIRDYFLAGTASGFTSYSINYLGYSKMPNLLNESSFSYGLSSIATPLLANSITDVGLSYLNYQINYGKQPKDFRSFYNNYTKSAYKIGFYTLSSFWGYNKQNSIWDMLMNPPSFGPDSISPPY